MRERCGWLRLDPTTSAISSSSLESTTAARPRRCEASCFGLSRSTTRPRPGSTKLIGTRVVDQSGIDRGPVVGVLANPAGDILELAGGALVPLRFVVASVPGERIDVDVPDGLFEATG